MGKRTESQGITKAMNTISRIALAAVLTYSGAIAVQAQDAANNEVTLRSQDETVNLTGELLSFEDDIYVIKTNLGALRISSDRVTCIGEACPRTEPEPVVEAFVPGIVTLRASDGQTEITGTLLAFEDDTYFLQTGFGELQIAAADNICVGDSCPRSRVDAKDVAIAASDELPAELLRGLLEGFAQFKDVEVTDETGDKGGKTLLFTQADGEEVANVTLASNTSTGAFESLIAGDADLAATTRSVRDEERVSLIGLNPDDTTQSSAETVLALDALAMVVSPTNRVRAISEGDIARIFSGEITDWAELGDVPGPINLYVRASESGTATVFDDLVMGPSGRQVSPTATIMPTDEAIARAVLTDPLGIGYTSYSTQGDAKALAVRGVCGIQTPVNDFTIKTEEYPLTRRIYMYRPQSLIPQPATEFVDFVKTNAAQDIVKRSGYIGQDVTSLSVNEQGLRFVSTILPSDSGDVDVDLSEVQDMLQNLVSAERLSLTFRFQPASTILDSRSQTDAVRLAEMIDEGAFDNKEILIIGFSDSVGEGAVNLNLSAARARQVRDSILAQVQTAQASDLSIQTIGYGEMSPLGCNETIQGRKINRRVEIWTKDIVGGQRG